MAEKSIVRKIIKLGRTRGITLGDIIPANWQWVQLKVLDRHENVITLEIVKLVGNNHDAQTSQTNQAGQQNA